MTAPQLPSWAAGRSPAGAPEPNSALDRQYAAFIGPRWATYRRKFAPFFADPRFTPTWNWAAALTIPFGAVWFLYRKLYLPFVFFWIAPGIVVGLLWGGAPPPTREMMSGSAAATDLLAVVAGVVLSAMVMAGGTANFLLFRRAQAAMRVVTAQAPGEGAVPILARVGRVNRTGVIVVLAILLAAQLAQFGVLPQP